MFGNSPKPAFGSTATTGTSLFGGGGNTTTTNTGFGSSGFGQANNAAASATDPPGTAVTPFQAHTEKEATNSAASNAYQNILFQEPYKKWSAEELRLADYMQGRRHGNATGGGAFGVTSNFGGGFGSNTQTPSAFGANANTNTANTGGLFGANSTNNTTNAATTGFGSTNSAFGNAGNTGGGGLFGSANKPAGGGLFGGGGAAQQNAGGFGAATGGGFGSTPNTTSAFGSSNTGTGLFGANKPQGGGVFGGGAAGASTTGGFGSTPNAFSGSTAGGGGGGLFGNNNNASQPTGGGLFGSNSANQQPQQNQGSAFGGGFGQANQNQQAGGSLFGNQQKPAGGGLFGGAPAQPAASGGMFSNAGQQQQNAGGFGANNAASGGGLFGSKPATGNSLFGATNNQASTNTGGMFGGLGANTQNQQPAGGGLFGSASNNQQQKTGLFGSTNQGGGSGLFGSQNNQNAGSSLFGGSNNQQPQQAGFANSFLGNSQQANNTPQGLTANLNDVSAYGSPSLFSSLNSTEVTNPGPLATPLNGSAKPKRGSILAMSKMAPSSASRYGTPQKRSYGFSYSTYGTPGGSPASSIASTPGTLGRSLLGSSSSGSLSKSMSVNNLRRNFNTEDSILAPGAFSSSSGPRWYGSTGSKKLVINRDIRSDLFSTPQKDKHVGDAASSTRKLAKRVSFDTSNVDAENQPVIRGALPAPEDSPSTQAEDTPRQNRHSTGSILRSTEVDPTTTTDLRDIREEEAMATPSGSTVKKLDSAPGDYYSEPSFEELQAMNRIQRQSVDGFVIGRHNVGNIAFKYPVDLTGIDLEELYGGLVQLEARSATVYPVAARKPPVGKGLNIPAKITLEQSWPRGSRDSRVLADNDKRVNKHIERLQRIPETTYLGYNPETGVWVFSVEHFTTYGLDDSEEDSGDDTEMPNLGDPQLSSPSQQMAMDVSLNSEMEDDTFQFKQSQALPGAFDQPANVPETFFPGQQSFLGVSSADSAPNTVPLSIDDEFTVDVGEEYDVSDDEGMTRSIVGQHLAAEQDDYSSESDQEIQRGTPGGVLRARMRAMKDSAEPVRLEVADGDDWMEMLRKTVSPVKRDRQVLKNVNESPRYRGALVSAEDGGEPSNARLSVWKKSTANKLDAHASTQVLEKNRGFATSIDLMNSLFEKPQPTLLKARASTSGAKGFPQVRISVAR